MVVCFIALFVFAFLGVFSLKYRKLAKEAFECVLRRITFKPCETKLDQRIRARLVSKIMKRSHKLAKFTNKYFEVIAWIFVIVFVTATVYSVITFYNLGKYGSCNPEHPEQCIFTGFEKQQGCPQNTTVYCEECLNETNCEENCSCKECNIS